MPRLVHGCAAGLMAGMGTAAFAAPLSAPVFNGADTAWMLICTVLVILMTMPGIMLFYSGMLRAKNALSVVAHTVFGAAAVTLTWAVAGYSLAFTPGTPFVGDLSRLFADGLQGQAAAGVHPLAPTVPEPVFFLFQLAFASITFALILGATAERMRVGVMAVFAVLWTLAVYAPVAHWVWQPSGWLARMGHMDYAGGTVVHITAGASGLAAAIVLGRRRGFGREPMVPHNLLITVLGAGLLWAGWFGFNAGSGFSVGPRAANALLVTHVAACSAAVLWGLCDKIKRGQWSVLGMLTGAIAGLIAITPASGFVGIGGALAIGATAGVVCFWAVVYFKAATGVDDTLDVFALHGMGGLLGTTLTPLFADPGIAPVTTTSLVNAMGGLVVMAYSGFVSWGLLTLISLVTPPRVSDAQEKVGLDLAQHGEMLTPSA